MFAQIENGFLFSKKFQVCFNTIRMTTKMLYYFFLDIFKADEYKRAAYPVNCIITSLPVFIVIIPSRKCGNYSDIERSVY